MYSSNTAQEGSKGYGRSLKGAPGQKGQRLWVEAPGEASQEPLRSVGTLHP